jgi:hypothetical protein
MELMSTSENKVLGRSKNLLALFHDFSALTSSFIGLGDGYHQYAADKLDVKIRSERLVNDVRQRAARAAGTAAAIFSTAAIDASTGTGGKAHRRGTQGSGVHTGGNILRGMAVERGSEFLGDRALMMGAHGGSGSPVGAAVDRVAAQTYRTEVLRDALTFQDSMASYAAEIYANNRVDPSGYAVEYDALVGTVREQLGGNKQQYGALAEGSKREHVLKIGRDRARENTAAARELINGLQGRALEQLDVAASLLGDSDNDVRNIGAAGLEKILGKIVPAMGASNGDGCRLLSSEEIARFEERFNNRIKSAVVLSLVERCDSGEDIDALVGRLAGGDIAVPRYGISASAGTGTGEGKGEQLGCFYAGMERIDMGADRGWANAVDRQILAARGALARRGVRFRELAALADTGMPGQLRGVTQPTIDEWFDSRYRDAIIGSRGGARDDIIKQLAERVDSMPGQVVAIMRGAVASGDNDAIQAAAPYVRVWQNCNPAALGRAFAGDEGTLVRMFALENGLSSASTTQVGVRDRTLKSFDNGGASGDRLAHYDELVATFASEDIIAHTLNDWKNNGAAVRDRVINMYRPMKEQNFEELSPFFLAAMQESFRRYLDYGGGDSAAATKMMRVHLSQLGETGIQSGTPRRGTLMAHCPENYPGVGERSGEIIGALENIGAEEFHRVMSTGLLPDGAQYLGSSLLDDDTTARMDGELRRNSLAGIDHIEDRHGNITRCPSYLHVLDYDYGTVLYRLPIGRYTPLVEGNNNGK